MKKILATLGMLAFSGFFLVRLVSADGTTYTSNWANPSTGGVWLTPGSCGSQYQLLQNGSGGCQESLTSYMVYPSSTVGIGAVGTQILPNSTLIVLSPSLMAINAALTATPTFSTSTLGPQGGTAWPDGQLLVVESTSTTALELQDNGTLSGSQLFLSGATQGNPQAFVTVSSTRTVMFMYNATNKGWNLIGR